MTSSFSIVIILVESVKTRIWRITLIVEFFLRSFKISFWRGGTDLQRRKA